MSGLFDGLLKPGDGSRLALQRELETRRAQWKRTGSYVYRGAGDFLLREGTFFQGRELPDRYLGAFGRPNACFENAVQACRDFPELRYFEGVYTNYGNYTPHAWCVDPDGGLVEVTWPTRPEQAPGAVDRLMKMPILAPDHMAYQGAEFSPDLIDWFVENYGEYCLLDRPGSDLDPGLRSVTALDMSQSHDNPILKVPYDPARTAL